MLHKSCVNMVQLLAWLKNKDTKKCICSDAMASDQLTMDNDMSGLTEVNLHKLKDVGNIMFSQSHEKKVVGACDVDVLGLGWEGHNCSSCTLSAEVG